MVKRIAVVRALQLGDLLVAVPALRALRGHFPSAEITLIGLPWAAGFAARFGAYIDRFLEFPGWPGIAEMEYDECRTATFLQRARAERYDLALQMHGSGVAMNGFALALGARMTAGYFLGECPARLSPAAPYPDDQPELLRNLGLVELLGAASAGTWLEFPLAPGDRAEARTLLPPGEPRIGIHAGASIPARRWPAARFAVVANQLVAHYGGQVILTGGPEETGIVRDVERQLDVPAVDLAGRTSLGGLAAVIAELDLFISNDTGPAHIANALSVPTVTIFGPADVRRWAPVDTLRHRIVHQPVACSPCGHKVCPIDHRCLLRIQPEDVLSAAESLLAKVKAA